MEFNQLISIFIVLIFYNIFLIVFMALKSSERSLFEFQSFLYLFAISSYALIVTKGKTLFAFPFLFLINYFFQNRKSVRISFSNFKFVVVANFIWIVFFFVFYIVGGFSFQLPHEDYFFYSQIAYYNEMFGVENIKGFHNLFSNQPRNEIYHFTELWAMGFGKWFNNQNLLVNFIFFNFPYLAFLSFLGFSELLKEKNVWLVLGVLVLSLFVIFPIDIFKSLFDLKIPMVGIGATIFGLKNLMIFPIILSILINLKEKELNFYSTSVYSFFYPVVIPVLIGSAILYGILFRAGRMWNLIFPIVLAIAFFGYSILTGSSTQGISFLYFYDIKFLLKVLWVAVVMPGLFLAFPFFVLISKKIFNREIVFFFCISLLISIFLWIIFSENINGNQMFRNVFHSVFCISVSLFIYVLFVEKKYSSFIVYVFLFVVPILYLFSSIEFIQTEKGDERFVDLLTKNEKILIIPNPSSVEGIYKYNEILYNPWQRFLLLEENLQFINIVGSYPEVKSLEDVVSKSTLIGYREESPFYQSCGELDFKNWACFNEFLKANNIKFVLSDLELFNQNLSIISKLGSSYLYSI